MKRKIQLNKPNPPFKKQKTHHTVNKHNKSNKSNNRDDQKVYNNKKWCIKEHFPLSFLNQHEPKHKQHLQNVKQILQQTEWKIYIPLHILSPDQQHMLLNKILESNKFTITMIQNTHATAYDEPDIFIENKQNTLKLVSVIFFLDLLKIEAACVRWMKIYVPNANNTKTKEFTFSSCVYWTCCQDEAIDCGNVMTRVMDKCVDKRLKITPTKLDCPYSSLYTNKYGIFFDHKNSKNITNMISKMFKLFREYDMLLLPHKIDQVECTFCGHNGACWLPKIDCNFSCGGCLLENAPQYYDFQIQSNKLYAIYTVNNDIYGKYNKPIPVSNFDKPFCDPYIR